MSALRELIAFFGVEVDDKKLDHSAEKMKGLAETAMKAGEAIGIAFGLHEISEFIQKQVELGTQLLHTSEMLGLSTDELQAFQYAGSNAGLGADEATTALRFMNKNIGEAAQGAGAAGPVFQKFGVHLKDAGGRIRPTSELLAEVADGISKLDSPAAKTAAAMEIFGRSGARMIPLLNKGSKGIEELYGEFKQLGGGLNSEFIEATEKTEHELNKLSLVGRGLTSVIAAELLPVFTGLVSWITDGAMAFRKFAEHSYIVQTSLTTLAAIAVGLAVVWAVLNIEIFAVIAAIALAILIIDDIYTAFKGGKSVIGDFIDAIFGIGTTKTIFDHLRSWANSATDEIAELANAIFVIVNRSRKAANEVQHFLSYVAHGQDAAEQKRYDAENAEFDKGYSKLRDEADGLQRSRNTHDAADAATFAKDDKGGFTRFSFKGETPEAPRASVTAPGASGIAHHGDIIKNNDVTVNVTGGADRDTGKAVQAAVLKAISDDDNQSAYAALPAGGGH